MQPSAAVRVERSGSAPGAGEVLSVAAVAQAVRDLDGERDVTLTISPVGGTTRLLIAVDGSAAFLGLEGSDGIFQFATHEVSGAEMARPFIIGGQEADIESRYVVRLQTAATVIQEWLGDNESSIGSWERR